MATNPNITQLDASQIAQRTYDGDNDAVRVSVGSAEFVVSGEGISASGTMTNGSSGQVIAATACPGNKEYQLYAVATTTTTGSITVRIDVSPADSGSIFYSTGTTLSLNASAANTIVVSSILTDLIARRVRVTITANNLAADEIVTVYIVGSTL